MTRLEASKTGRAVDGQEDRNLQETFYLDLVQYALRYSKAVNWLPSGIRQQVFGNRIPDPLVTAMCEPSIRQLKMCRQWDRKMPLPQLDNLCILGDSRKRGSKRTRI